LLLSPSTVEYYHFELPSESSKVIVLKPLYQENAYIKPSVLPNTSPRWPQLLKLLPIVYFIQATAVEDQRGLNLNKSYPVHEPPS